MLPMSGLTKSIVDLSSTSDAGAFAGWARDQAAIHGRGFLVPHLSNEAARSDNEAINLFHGAGGWLARLAYTVHRRTKGTADSISIRAVGGLWDAGAYVQDGTVRALGKWFSNVEFARFGESNLAGGIRLAQSFHGGHSTQR